MALQPFTNEQLNYFKFAFVVLNEFPKVLRQTFKHMWDNTFAHHPGYQPWDDSITVRNMFFANEGGKTKVPTRRPYEEWDCTALFQATIYAQSFALPDRAGRHRTLSDLYLKHRKPPPGTFHSSVVSAGGDDAETFVIAIDQLRLLRNAFCHSCSSEIDKKTFDQYIQHTKDAIRALGVTTDPIDAVGSLNDSDFPTEKVFKLKDDITKELRTENTFLKENVEDKLMGMRSDLTQLRQERQEDSSELRKTIEKATAINQEMTNEKIAEVKELLKTERPGKKPALQGFSYISSCHPFKNFYESDAKM